MKRFRKIVAIEPLGLVPEADAELKTYADEVIYCHDIPADDAEIIGRIGDADAVMLSYTSGITAGVIEKSSRKMYESLFREDFPVFYKDEQKGSGQYQKLSFRISSTEHLFRKPGNTRVAQKKP